MEHFRAHGSVEQNLENILTPKSSWTAGIPGYEANWQVDGKGGGTFRKGGSQGPQTMHSSPHQGLIRRSSPKPSTELSMNGQAEEGETEAQRGQVTLSRTVRGHTCTSTPQRTWEKVPPQWDAPSGRCGPAPAEHGGPFCCSLPSMHPMGGHPYA